MSCARRVNDDANSFAVEDGSFGTLHTDSVVECLAVRISGLSDFLDTQVI